MIFLEGAIEKEFDKTGNYEKAISRYEAILNRKDSIQRAENFCPDLQSGVLPVVGRRGMLRP